MYILFRLIVIAPFLTGHFHVSAQRHGTWNVRDFGAAGDSVTVDTKAIQKAIDACHQSGGGTVLLTNGLFISGTLYLKDHVYLSIASGAVLKGSSNLDHYPITPSKHPSYSGDLVTNKMLIYAEGAHNIGITGSGTIDGNGDEWAAGPYGSPSFSVRPRILHFRGCHNVQIREITLRNSASWVQSYQNCRNLVISGITVDSRENKDIEKPRYADAKGRNTDGLDLVDCEQVRISNCHIDSGDDAICLKSLSPDGACRDITITNCTVSSNASGIKIGTETAGVIEDIVVSNCTVYDTRVDALSVMTVDGARIARVSFSNISMRNIKGAAIFVRLGTRNRPYRKNASTHEPTLSDIRFDNIQGDRISTYGCSVTGLENLPVRRVSFTNIRLRFTGGMQQLTIDDQEPTASTTKESAELSARQILERVRQEVPEKAEAYPRGEMFGKLPAYGFYVRHAEDVSWQNIDLSFDQSEFRPAFLLDRVANVSVGHLEAKSQSTTPMLMLLRNAGRVTVSNSIIRQPAAHFVWAEGAETREIALMQNVVANGVNLLYRGENLPDDAVRIENNLHLSEKNK